MTQLFLAKEPILNYQHLGVAVSWRCNAHCTHCFIPRYKRRQSTYQRYLISKILNNLPESIRIIGFTGGEPFLNPEKLIREVNKVGRTGRTSSVVTNGLWVRNGVKTSSMLQNAYKAGLRKLSISYDYYHQPQLDNDDITKIFRLAMDAGLQVNIVGVGKGSRNLFLELEKSGVLGGRKIMTNLDELDNVGEAKELPADRIGSYRLERCICVMFPFVSPLGEVYACCSSRLFEIRNDVLHLGNIRQTPISGILDKAARDYLLVALFVLGPKALYKMLDPNAHIDRSKYQCDICVSLLNDSQKVNKLRELIAEDVNFRKKLVAKYMINKRTLDAEYW